MNFDFKNRKFIRNLIFLSSLALITPVLFLFMSNIIVFRPFLKDYSEILFKGDIFSVDTKEIYQDLAKKNVYPKNYLVYYESSPKEGSTVPLITEFVNNGEDISPSNNLKAKYGYEIVGFEIIEGEGNGEFNELTGDIKEVVGSMRIQVNFEKLPEYRVVYKSSPGGSFYEDELFVYHGNVANAPDFAEEEGYVFVDFEILDGNGEVDSFTGFVSNVTEDLTIRANFRQANYECYKEQENNDSALGLSRLGLFSTPCPFEKSWTKRSCCPEVWKDNVSGLSWTGSFGSMSWEKGADFCSSTEILGLSGWRLPTKDEFLQVINHEIHSDAFNPSEYLWLMNEFSEDSTKSWAGNLNNSFDVFEKTESKSISVHCVLRD